jgi:16S rRNA (cytosine967-C5)-methyltransferase
MRQRPDRTRERATGVLREAERGVFADQLLDRARTGLDNRDRAFLLELVYGVLRNRARLDWLLDRFSAQPVARTDPWTRNILRLAAYQLLFLDKVPASAAVNTATELAKAHGRKPQYVNGLLRTLERNKENLPLPADEDPAARLAVLYSHPRWLVQRWIGRFGADRAEDALRRNNLPAPLCIRANGLKGSRDDLIARLGSQGAVARRTTCSPVGIEVLASPGLTVLPAYQEGRFMVQDEAAQLVSLMLAPRPGETVLDACAAPGGKATHLAELMQDQGRIVALESDPDRLPRIAENAARLGVSIIEPVLGDAATFSEGAYDRILIDAPCSGLGVLRRHPDGRWTKSEESIREKQSVQQRVLENCSRLLKPGGHLVYATCTTEKEENEDVISHFKRIKTQFVVIEKPHIDSIGPCSELIDHSGSLRTFPSSRDLDGFFAVLLRRTARPD